MPLSFAGHLDRSAMVRVCDQVSALVTAPEVARRWTEESALPGLTIGGLTRHLVSQPECAVEFLGIQPVPPRAPTLSLAECYARTDWFGAGVESPENTSIRDDFNEMAAGGPAESADILDGARAQLPAAIEAAGMTTYVPWQDCCLATDDFLVVRLMETVVHADDLAASLGRSAPAFDPEITDPVVALLAMLAVRRHGSQRVVPGLARSERTPGTLSAF